MSSSRGSSDSDAVLPVLVGTIVWAVAVVVLLLQGDGLAEQGRQWWLGVALVGLVSGAGGVAFLMWRKRRRAA